jgi:protein-histidine pros-kinase
VGTQPGESISTNGVVRTVLITSFIVALLVGAGGAYLILHERAVQRTAAEAGRLLTVATAVRSYTTEEVIPVVHDDAQFHAVTVPAFAAQSVYRLVRGTYSGYVYREPALNPTNPEDMPTPFDVELLSRFRADPKLTELRGVRSDGNERVYYLARPIRAQAPCLQCHDTPQRAPATMVAKYGPNHGFGWKQDEIVAMQSLSVPAAAELQETGEIALLLAGGLLLVFLITYFVLTLAIDGLVVRPLQALAHAADAASTGEDGAVPLPSSGTHEIRSIAAAIERLRTSLAKSLQRLAGSAP